MPRLGGKPRTDGDYADRLNRGCFGAILRDARLAAGINGLEMAQRLGISRTALTYMEKGENMKEQSVRRYAEALGLEVDLILRRSRNA